MSVVIVSLSSMDNLEKRLGVTPLDRLAHQMHEIYSAFVNAGFTPDQAMDLLLNINEKDKKRV